MSNTVKLKKYDVEMHARVIDPIFRGRYTLLLYLSRFMTWENEMQDMGWMILVVKNIQHLLTLPVPILPYRYFPKFFLTLSLLSIQRYPISLFPFTWVVSKSRDRGVKLLYRVSVSDVANFLKQSVLFY